jgi:membrane protease YdiL (CAAX protease family)
MGRSGPLRVRRRRVAAAVLPAGTGLLGLSLAAEGDDPLFYCLTLGLAGTWAAGTLASGPIPVGAAFTQPGLRSLAEPVLTGAGTFGLFYAAARVARRNPALNRAISSVLGYMDTGAAGLILLTACLNAVAEEMFFHGALWDAAGPDHPVAATAAVYTASTLATRNPALVLSGAVTSLIFGAQRRRSGGVAAPAIAHVIWSVLMLTLLPPLFPPEREPAL